MWASGSSDTLRWYFLKTLSDGPAFATREWLAWASENVDCPGCRQLRLGVGAVDLHVLGIPDRQAAINFVRGPCSIHFGRRDFLELFGRSLHEQGRLGKVIDVDGRELRNYATFTPEGGRLILRGSVESKYSGRCSACGQVRYLAIGGPYHVMRADLGKHDLYVCKSGLMVNHELFMRIERKRWHKLSVSKVRVVDEPLDGYPAEL
jgi:hypothetical protein